MNVSGGSALYKSETADAHVLADNGTDHLLELFVYGKTGLKIKSKKCVNISGLVCYDSLFNAGDEFLEYFVLCSKVCLGVDLDDNSLVAVYHNVNNTLCCDSACLLCSACKSSLAEDLCCLVKVAVCLGESLFALHHAGIGLCAELGNHFCCNSCHFI